jgi:hypothetical protein
MSSQASANEPITDIEGDDLYTGTISTFDTFPFGFPTSPDESDVQVAYNTEATPNVQPQTGDLAVEPEQIKGKNKTKY